MSVHARFRRQGRLIKPFKPPDSGQRLHFAVKSATDPFGPAIIDQLKRDGIATEYVSTATGLLTGTAVILVEASGQNSIITHAGPNVVLSADDVLPRRFGNPVGGYLSGHS